MLKKEWGREGRKRGKEGAREREKEVGGGREGKEKESVVFQLLSGTALAKTPTMPNSHGVSITHQGTAAIF